MIKNGLVVDGTGARKPFPSDVGIIEDKIVEIGRLEDADAVKSIDVKGQYIAPGFVDIHTHEDWYIPFQNPKTRFESFIRQGITTSVVGNCGWTMAPCFPQNKQILIDVVTTMSVPVEHYPWNTMAEYLQFIEEQELMVNIAHLVGHGAVRIAVMGNECRFCTPDELAKMKTLVREAMEAGCFGLSTGLQYYPGIYSQTDELVELAKELKPYGGRYVTHLRGQSTTLPYAVAEAIEVAEKADIPLEISHLCQNPLFGFFFGAIFYYTLNIIELINSLFPLPGLPNKELKEALNKIDAARERDLDIGIDCIPYTIGNSTITSLFPPAANQGGVDALIRRLKDPIERKRIYKEIREAVPVWPHWGENASWSDPILKVSGWKPLRILSCKKNKWAEGKTITEISKKMGLSYFDALCEIVIDERAKMLYEYGYKPKPWMEKVSSDVIHHKDVSFATDTLLPWKGIPTIPSGYGCFPRIIGHFCRDLKYFPVEEAVYRLSGLSAKQFNLDRGVLKPGGYADITVFDFNTITDRYDKKGRPIEPQGISHVFLNGRQILADGKMQPTGFHGRLLKRR